MSDDQVGREWVSVSSSTGLPGLSRTKAIKRLCVLHCNLRMTEPRPQLTCTKNVKFEHVVFEICEHNGRKKQTS